MTLGYVGEVPQWNCCGKNGIRDDIKSSGKFTIFARLKIEGGGGQRHIREKLPLKIQTVEDIYVKTLFCVYGFGCVCTLLFIPQLHVHGKIATKN